MLSCYAMYKFGTGKIRNTYLNSKYSGLKIGKWWEISIKVLAPVIAGIMFVWWTVQCIGWEENWWSPFGINNLGTFVFQGLIIAIVAYCLNNKIAKNTTSVEIPEGELFADVPDNGYSA